MALLRIFQAGCDTPECWESITVCRTGLEPALAYLKENGWHVALNPSSEPHEIQCPICANGD